MTVQLTDLGEKQIFEDAYDGEEFIIGLYNEENDVTYSQPDVTEGFEDYIYGVYNNPQTTSDVPNNTVAPGERATVAQLEKSEPDKSVSYSRQTVEASAEYVRRDSGRLNLSRDLSARVSFPRIVFDVKDNERVVNAIFVILEETGNVHFTVPLDEQIVLDNVDDELVINGAELFLE